MTVGRRAGARLDGRTLGAGPGGPRFALWSISTGLESGSRTGLNQGSRVWLSGGGP